MYCLTERRYLVLTEDDDHAAADVPSPCVSICQIEPRTGWCRGCLRTLDEIGDWRDMSNDEKRHVWQQLPMRFDICLVRNEG